MLWTTLLIAIAEWIMLVFTRTHFFIDFTTAIAFAILLNRFGEWLSYYSDVKGLGYPKIRRSYFNYVPCDKCGRPNERPCVKIKCKVL
jgi:hypothetical protein